MKVEDRRDILLNLKIFLVVAFILLLLGFIFIYSASSVFALEKFGSASFFVKKQLMGFLISCFVLLGIIIIPLEVIKKNISLFFLITLLLTGLTLIPGFSREINGSSRWLCLFGFVFHPSEMLKVSLILYVAYLIEKRGSYFILLLSLIISCGILLKQPDFGMAVVLCLTAFIMLFISKFKTKYLLFTWISFIPVCVALVLFKPYRLKRILVFLNPWQDPQGSGFQIIQSLIAIGSGSLWGVGISNSRQKFFYLPMQHTDFIFSIIAEEIGFIGAVFLILLFILFLYFGLKISWQLKDNFCTFAVLGFVILISLQALINFYVTLGLFPTKGIGLPFVSYGKSSLICNIAMIGFIINYVRNN